MNIDFCLQYSLQKNICSYNNLHIRRFINVNLISAIVQRLQ